MICTVIAYTSDGDCRVLRQPLSNFPVGIEEYVKKAKCAAVCRERKLAYSALFSALSEFFGVETADIKRKDSGKPYLVGADGAALPYFISVSHSDGVAAVSISDEREIGVDIQCEIAPGASERLEERYFRGVRVKYYPLPVKYFIFDGNMSLNRTESYSKVEEPSFSAKWSFCEAALKCEGGGFGSIKRIEDITENIDADIIELSIGEKRFFASTVAVRNY